MIKKITFIFLIIVISYYAGYERISPKNVLNWFDVHEISQTIKKALNKTIEIASENDLDTKTGEIIKDLKNNITN